MGRDTLDPVLLCVIAEAYRKPLTIASDYARAHKEEIAEAACLGLLTVFYPQAEYGALRRNCTDHTWRVTPAGLAAILDT